ncbi:16143_t:CDS:2, partial [Racocetra persica]
MEQAVVLEYPEIQHLFCIWHVKKNIKKILRSKLGGSFDEFYSKFWQYRNADTLHGFEYYWGQLISFPNTRLYFERYLYERWFSEVLRSKNESNLKNRNGVLLLQQIHSTVEEVESLIICESSQSKDMDSELDAVNLSAKCLLDCLE